MSTWYLEVDGTKRSLNAWGIIQAELTRVNQARDQLKLTTAAATRFVFEQPVVLWLDNQRYFSGLVTDPGFEGSATQDRRNVVVSGPWWYLDNIVYQQPRWVINDAFNIKLGYKELYTSATTLFIDTAAAGSAFAGAQAKFAFDWAKSHGAPIARASIFGLDAATVPWETGTDLSCAEVIKRCARWSRDAVAWWDYSVEVPVLNFARRPDLTAVELDLDAADVLQEFSLQPCYDLQLRGVLINFIKVEVNKEGEEWLSITKQYAGTADSGLRCAVITFRLGGKGTTAEKEPLGLAALLYDSVKDLHWRGSIVLKGIGLGITYGVGKKINLIGGDAEWATMGAIVQQVTEDLINNQVRLEIGPPEQLGVQDFAELIATRSGTNKSGGGVKTGGEGEQKNGQPDGGGGAGHGGGGGGGGGTSPPSGSPDSNSNGTIPLQVCVDGKPVTINVPGNFAK